MGSCWWEILMQTIAVLVSLRGPNLHLLQAFDSFLLSCLQRHENVVPMITRRGEGHPQPALVSSTHPAVSMQKQARCAQPQLFLAEPYLAKKPSIWGPLTSCVSFCLTSQKRSVSFLTEAWTAPRCPSSWGSREEVAAWHVLRQERGLP